MRVVHQGYWTTPSTMENANSRFLCIEAVVKSPQQATEEAAADIQAMQARTDPLLFLVDTGSECSALTRDVIHKLQLPRKGETTVVGVNSRTTADVYSGVLEIGGQDVPVNVKTRRLKTECLYTISSFGVLAFQVVEAETNAVGIATVSKFCHFISPTAHDWLHR